jgi:putative DNA primase/helicase
MLDSQAREEAVQQFADVLASAGLLLKGLPVMDGQLHHVPTQRAKTKSDNAGVYVGHLDGGVPAG